MAIVQIKELKFIFINVYAPNIGLQWIELFGKLNTEIRKHVDEGILVIMGGDWNCTTNFLLDRNGEEPHSQSSKMLLKVTQELDLIDVWRNRNQLMKQYTWVKILDSIVTGARLDRIYVNKLDNNRVMNAGISPCGFSDHHILTIDFNTTRVLHPKSYWHFNIKLLYDTFFCENFKCFWEKGKLEKEHFENVIQWWDVGKVQIKIFCQQFSYNNTVIVKREIERLDKGSDMENLLDLNTLGETNDLNKKRLELKTLLDERAKGALVRARISSIKEMDAPTKFFLNLERKVAKKKNLLYLRKDNATVTSDPIEMRKIAMRFYAELFGPKDSDPASMDQLLEGLPNLKPEDKETLDSMVSYEELSEAVMQLSTGRAPGVDGLPAEFYKSFWNVLGEDFYSVIGECLKKGILPSSCQRAVLSLLPKTGDLGLLKNWRPVSLMCQDYKILSKCLANRLKKFLCCCEK